MSTVIGIDKFFQRIFIFLVNFVQMIKNKSSLSLLDGTVAADQWPAFYCLVTSLKNWPGANSWADATAENRKIFYPVCVLKSLQMSN